jgi:Cu/Ag efflux protein CusF
MSGVNKKNIIPGLAAAAFLLLGHTPASAHNGIEHISGTVKAKTDTSVTVDTVEHTTTNVLLDSATTFTWGEKKASLKDLKVGDHVAINAKETPDEKLHGISINWKK